MSRNLPLIRRVLRLYGERIVCAGDIVRLAKWCFTSDVERDGKWRYSELEVLTCFLDVVTWEVATDTATWEESMRELCNNEEFDMKTLSALVRLAITGQKAGPSIFECLIFLGVQSVKERVNVTILHGLHIGVIP